MSRDRDDGYALVAAVTAVAAFAFIAFEVLAVDRGEIESVTGRTEQAKLAAAADAGVMVAIHALARDDRAERWPIDGTAQHVDFAGADLTIVVQDERGKAPLDGLSDAQSRALFAGAGASGDRLDALVDEFRAWQLQSAEDLRGGGVDPAAGDVAPGYQARHGAFVTVGELMGLKDMDAALYNRIAPVVTTFFEESGPFQVDNAHPLAIQTMSAQDLPSPEIAAQGAVETQQPVEQIADDNLIGRTLTVDVIARNRHRAQAHRMAIVELTDSKTQPYWIRYAE